MTDSLKNLKDQYGLDFIEEFVINDDRHFTFYFDFQVPDPRFYIISKKQSLFNNLSGNSFTFEDIIPYIVKDNKLAEVEGKMTFIEDIKRKISRLSDETYLFLPINDRGTLYWLTIGLYVKTYENNKPKIVFGRVNMVQTTTPNEIHYYQLAHQDPATRLFTRETLRKHVLMQNDFFGSWGLYIDIDGFKRINDTYGHKVGDLFLVKLAETFIGDWEKDVIYYRLGGDEFFVRVNGHSKLDVENRANRLVSTIENIEIEGYQFDVSASIGIVEIDSEHCGYDEILDNSDKAMYVAKTNKNQRYHFHKD